MGYQYRFDIAGTEYGMSDVSSCKLEHPLFDKLSVGNTCSAELDITFWPKSDIPKMAKIVPYCIAEDGTETKLGEFWTDIREQVGDRLHIIAYDAMMRGDVVWVPRDDLQFPAPDGLPMPDAVAEICRLMDVKLDSRTVLSSSYGIDHPANDWTLRDVLGFIGAAHGGNWTITAAGELLLIPLFAPATGTVNYLANEDGDPILFGGEAILV